MSEIKPGDKVYGIDLGYEASPPPRLVEAEVVRVGKVAVRIECGERNPRAFNCTTRLPLAKTDFLWTPRINRTPSEAIAYQRAKVLHEIGNAERELDRNRRRLAALAALEASLPGTEAADE